MCAVAAFAGALAGPPLSILLAPAGAALLWKRRAIALVLAAAGAASLVAMVTAPGDVPPVSGSGVFVGVATSDPGRSGFSVRVNGLRGGDGVWSEATGNVWVRETKVTVAVGEPVAVTGTAEGASFRVRSGRMGGVIASPDSVTRLGEASNPLLRAGNRVRARVLRGLGPSADAPAGALLSGFLIGEVSALPDADYDALRRAGLSHYVAVSGSNVALFLAFVWLVSGPLGWSPRSRAITGLCGLAVFVVVTRWEPSVLRAAAMAAIVLVGKLRGWAITPWAALGWAVAGLLVIDPALSRQVGFQLSVAATAGILAGLPVWRRRQPAWLWSTLGATAFAQLAVAPLLLMHFGSVPLLAPLSNLVAAPLVAASTIAGGVGALLGAGGLVVIGTRLAALVLWVARTSADLPQLGGATAVLGIALSLLAVFVPRLRVVVALAGVATAAIVLLPARPPAGPTLSVLDVGQGDSILFQGPSGETILVDGGPDPDILSEHLRRRGVTHIDLLVASHLHADHMTGLLDLPVPVTRMWHPPQLGQGSVLDAVVAEMAAKGTPTSVPETGSRAQIGVFVVEVIGPVRRYASPNDGSLVLRIEAAGSSALLTGDIEAIAQADLGPIHTDVMKVPHQGSATSDLEWLERSAPRIAIIPVGPNSYGHPSREVIAVLERAGAVVLRTDHDGTVSLRLDRLRQPFPLPSAA